LSQGRGWKSQCRARSRSTRVFPDHRGLHAVVENLARCSSRSPRTQRRGSAKLTAGPDGRQTAPDQARIAKHQALERVRKAASSKQQAEGRRRGSPRSSITSEEAPNERGTARFANLDNGVFDRLGRYEAMLWRQAVQMLIDCSPRSDVVREKTN
jgi:hypothetical protein